MTDEEKREGSITMTTKINNSRKPIVEAYPYWRIRTWYCPACGAANDIDRTSCSNCNQRVSI